VRFVSGKCSSVKVRLEYNNVVVVVVVVAVVVFAMPAITCKGSRPFCLISSRSESRRNQHPFRSCSPVEFRIPFAPPACLSLLGISSSSSSLLLPLLLLLLLGSEPCHSFRFY